MWVFSCNRPPYDIIAPLQRAVRADATKRFNYVAVSSKVNHFLAIELRGQTGGNRFPEVFVPIYAAV